MTASAVTFLVNIVLIRKAQRNFQARLRIKRRQLNSRWNIINDKRDILPAGRARQSGNLWYSCRKSTFGITFGHSLHKKLKTALYICAKTYQITLNSRKIDLGAHSEASGGTMKIARTWKEIAVAHWHHSQNCRLKFHEKNQQWLKSCGQQTISGYVNLKYVSLLHKNVDALTAPEARKELEWSPGDTGHCAEFAPIPPHWMKLLIHVICYGSVIRLNCLHEDNLITITSILICAHWNWRFRAANSLLHSRDMISTPRLRLYGLPRLTKTLRIQLVNIITMNFSKRDIFRTSKRSPEALVPQQTRINQEKKEATETNSRCYWLTKSW